MIRPLLVLLSLMACSGADAARVAVTGRSLQGAGIAVDVPFSARGASQFGLSVRPGLVSVSAGSRWFLTPGQTGLYAASYGYGGLTVNGTAYGGAATLGYRWPLAEDLDFALEGGWFGAARRESGHTTGHAGLTAGLEIGFRF